MTRLAVLIVDDEEDFLTSVRGLLEANRPDLDVHTAPSPSAALAIMERVRIDALVSDYRMPGMTGLEFLAAAGRLAPKAPKVLVTAFPDTDLAIQAKNELAIDSFLTKPFRPEEFLERLEEALADAVLRGRAARGQAKRFDEARRSG